MIVLFARFSGLASIIISERGRGPIRVEDTQFTTKIERVTALNVFTVFCHLKRDFMWRVKVEGQKSKLDIIIPVFHVFDLVQKWQQVKVFK